MAELNCVQTARKEFAGHTMDRTAWLQVPEGAYAGDMLTFACGGQEMSIRVPDGFCAGDTFGIQLPNYIYADAGDYDGSDYGGSGCDGSGCGGSGSSGSDCGGSDCGDMPRDLQVTNFT